MNNEFLRAFKTTASEDLKKNVREAQSRYDHLDTKLHDHAKKKTSQSGIKPNHEDYDIHIAHHISTHPEYRDYVQAGKDAAKARIAYKRSLRSATTAATNANPSKKIEIPAAHRKEIDDADKKVDDIFGNIIRDARNSAEETGRSVDHHIATHDKYSDYKKAQNEANLARKKYIKQQYSKK